MSMTDAGPPDQSGSLDEPLGRQGWRRRALVVLILTAAVAVVVGIRAVGVYQPLGAGTGGYAVARLDATGAPDYVQQVEPNLTSFGQYVVDDAPPGSTIRVVFPLSNAGRLPVRITGIGSPIADSSVASLRVYSADMSGDLSTMRPFHPIMLHRGQIVQLSLDITLRSCPEAPYTGVFNVFDSVPVRYTVWGIRHEARAPINMMVGVKDQPSC